MTYFIVTFSYALDYSILYLLACSTQAKISDPKAFVLNFHSLWVERQQLLGHDETDLDMFFEELFISHPEFQRIGYTEINIPEK